MSGRGPTRRAPKTDAVDASQNPRSHSSGSHPYTMPIVKIEVRKRTHPFAMIDARPLNDPRISWKAKGLHAYLMSKPKDWHVIFADLVKHATDRAYSVRTALNELLGLGYAKLQPLKDERGLFCGSCWTVYEWPEQFLAQSGDDGFLNLGKIGVSGKEKSRETGVSGKPNPTNNGKRRRPHQFAPANLGCNFRRGRLGSRRGRITIVGGKPRA